MLCGGASTCQQLLHWAAGLGGGAEVGRGFDELLREMPAAPVAHYKRRVQTGSASSPFIFRHAEPSPRFEGGGGFFSSVRMCLPATPLQFCRPRSPAGWGWGLNIQTPMKEGCFPSRTRCRTCRTRRPTLQCTDFEPPRSRPSAKQRRMWLACTHIEVRS